MGMPRGGGNKTQSHDLKKKRPLSNEKTGKPILRSDVLEKTKKRSRSHHRTRVMIGEAHLKPRRKISNADGDSLINNKRKRKKMTS